MSEVDEYIVNLDGSSKAIVEALRQFMLSEFPQLKEDFKWKQPVYTLDGKDVAYIVSTKAGANFGLVNGALLKDPQNLLTGTGKLMRHIKIPDLDSIDTIYFKDLVSQAMDEQGAKTI